MGDELLRIWRDTGATIVLITHALDEAAMLSDRIGIMSARPGRFIDIVPTNWPRERDSRIVADPRFGEITGRLWTSLREEFAARDGVGKVGRRHAVSAITSNGSTSTVPPLARLVASV